MDLVTSLNSRDEIDGILIQLPLPAQVDTKALLDAVDPAKDVDGFHPVNAGRLQAGRPALAPCTPAGAPWPSSPSPSLADPANGCGAG